MFKMSKNKKKNYTKVNIQKKIKFNLLLRIECFINLLIFQIVIYNMILIIRRVQIEIYHNLMNGH